MVLAKRGPKKYLARGCDPNPHSRMYFSEPEPELGSRPIGCARGKVVGGSSSVNAMAYVRGHRGDCPLRRLLALATSLGPLSPTCEIFATPPSNLLA